MERTGGPHKGKIILYAAVVFCLLSIVWFKEASVFATPVPCSFEKTVNPAAQTRDEAALDVQEKYALHDMNVLSPTLPTRFPTESLPPPA